MKIIEKTGGNGKVMIDIEAGTATKSLLPKRRKESIERYKLELKALEKIRKLNIPNIVEVFSIDETNMIMVMKAYDGDLSDLFKYTKNNPRFCSQLLIPVIQSLKVLAELDTPIYHRDLKPANILYNCSKDGPSLFISDFGCCYFTQSDDRQTPTFKAVGAQSYRAPEYDYGRVEEVTSKGDVYSIGKILWAMLNGVKNEIFPYTLWFPKEYNLLNRFENSPELILSNLIIAKCVSINPEERPSYEELIQLMQKLSKSEFEQDTEKQSRVKLFSAQRELALSEIREINTNMLRIFYEDFILSLDFLCKTYPDFLLLNHLKTEYYKTYKSKELHISHKIQNDVASYIFSTSYDNIYFSIDYHPTYSSKDNSSDDKYASISVRYNISSNNASDILTIKYKNKTLHTIYQDTSSIYDIKTLTMFLEKMIDIYINSFD